MCVCMCVCVYVCVCVCVFVCNPPQRSKSLTGTGSVMLISPYSDKKQNNLFSENPVMEFTLEKQHNTYF